MSVRPSHWLYGLLALAVAVGLWRTLADTDARRIGRRLGELEALIGKEGDESQLATLDRARRLGGLFAEGFEVDLGPVGQKITDRQGLGRIFFRYRSRAERIVVSFGDRDLVVDEGLRHAELASLATVTSWGGGGGPSREKYSLRLAWREEGDDWRLERVELLEIIEGPAGWF